MKDKVINGQPAAGVVSVDNNDVDVTGLDYNDSSWDHVASMYKEVGNTLIKQQRLFVEYVNSYRKIINDKQETIQIVDGIGKSYNHIANELIKNGLTHGINLHTILERVIAEDSENIVKTEVVTFGQPEPRFTYNVINPLQFINLFNKYVNEALTLINGGVLEQYVVLLEDNTINFNIQPIAFKIGPIDITSDDHIKYMELYINYDYIEKTIADVTSAMVIDLTPILGLDPNYAEEIKAIKEVADAVLSKAGVK